MLLEDEKRMIEGRRIKRMKGQQWERPSDIPGGLRTVMPGAPAHGVTRQLRQEV